MTPTATFERDEFLAALTHCRTVIERRSTLPILSTVLLTVEKHGKGHRLRLDATNMDAEISRTVATSSAAPGSVAINAATLTRVLTALPKRSTITMTAGEKDSRVMIGSGDAKAELARYEPSEFPAPSTNTLPHAFELPSTQLRWLIETAAFAICTEETRYYLNGIFLHYKAANENGNALRAVATNGHTLARLSVAAPEGCANMPDIIIPRASLPAVLGLIGRNDDETPVKIAVGETGVSFSTKNARIYSKLIDGKFPDYERVIPSHIEHTVKFRAAEIVRAVSLGRAIHGETSKTAPRSVNLEISPGAMRVVASSPDEGTTGADVRGVGGSISRGVVVGFNSGYLLSILARMKGAEVELGINDAASPSTWRIANRDDALFICMPMRV